MSTSGTYVDFGTRYNYLAAAMAEGVKTNQFPPAVLSAAVDLIELAEQSIEESEIPRNPVASSCAYSLVTSTLRKNLPRNIPRLEVDKLVRKLAASVRDLRNPGRIIDQEVRAILEPFFSGLAKDSEERAYDSWCSGKPSKYSFSI